jgi:hypothetical protein
MGNNWGTGLSYSTCLIVFTINASVASRAILRGAELASYGFIPIGTFERLIGKVLAWSTRTSGDDVASGNIYKNLLILRFGSQRFRLMILPDLNCIRLDVEGENPLPVYQRVMEMVDSVVKECMSFIVVFTMFVVPTDVGTGVGAQLDSSAVFVNKENVQRAVAGDVMLSRVFDDVSVELGSVRLKELYGRWLPSKGFKAYYDLFVSHRWLTGGFDDKLVKAIYDRSTLYTLGTSLRVPVVFLDSERLEGGEDFREGFLLALIRSTMVAVILSNDALQKMLKHSPTLVDNLLLEWISTLACKELKIVEKVYPILIGKWDERTKRCGNLYGDRTIDLLPETVPTATIEEAKALFLRNNLTFPAPMERFTVKQIVSKVNLFLGYLAWEGDDTGSDIMTQQISDKIMDELKKCPQEKLNRTDSSTHTRPAVAPTQPALAHSASTPARIGIQPPVSSPAPSGGGGRDVAAAWALLSDDKCVKTGDKDRLSQLLDNLGVKSAADLETLLKARTWEQDLEPVIACLKKAKMGAFRKYVGLA